MHSRAHLCVQTCTTDVRQIMCHPVRQLILWCIFYQALLQNPARLQQEHDHADSCLCVCVGLVLFMSAFEMRDSCLAADRRGLGGLLLCFLGDCHCPRGHCADCLGGLWQELRDGSFSEEGRPLACCQGMPLRYYRSHGISY